MSRILIWRKPVPGSDLDIFNRFDNDNLYHMAIENKNMNTLNWGNKVWYQGICSVIDTPDNELTYGTDESPEEINHSYDLIIYPMANFFSERFCNNVEGIVSVFSRITIPVYIIACGAQAKSYDDLDRLIHIIGDEAKKFIETIYHTGGEFALRGYFTKEFFDLLGYHSAIVTGCPSLFQLGPDLKVYKENSEAVIPLINGQINNFESILRSIPDSYYLAQDTFFDCLFNPRYFEYPSIKKDIRFIRYHSTYQAKLLGENRIKMFPNVNQWYHFIKYSGCNYSFGTKIHGNIMSILAGIPSTVLYVDSRTQEMSEFFEVPSMPMILNHKYSIADLLEAYEKADYSLFNEHFSEKYYAFEQFLKQHRIVKSLNRGNRFLFIEEQAVDNFAYNTADFLKYAEKLNKEKILLSVGRLFMKARDYGKMM